MFYSKWLYPRIPWTEGAGTGVASTDWGKIPINQISLPQAMKTRL
jgi:hypothetical protein